MYKKYPFLFIYFFPLFVVLAWWMLAFRAVPFTSSYRPEFISQELSLRTSQLLPDLTSFEREKVHQALSGDVTQILELIQHWNSDAQILALEHVPAITWLSENKYLHALDLGYHVLKESSDNIQKKSKKILPQSYIAASFLLSLVPTETIMAIPKGLHYHSQLYHYSPIDTIKDVTEELRGERLFAKKPDLVLVAPYSHPRIFTTLKNQKLDYQILKDSYSLGDICTRIIETGRLCDQEKKAHLLSIFVEACFLAIDNRLRALQFRDKNQDEPFHFLFVKGYQNYCLPTKKNLTGQLLNRLLKNCHSINCPLSPENDYWSVPVSREYITKKCYDCLIISTLWKEKVPHFFSQQPFIQDLYAFQKKNIYLVDEAVQDSPTHYYALAYFDLYQALVAARYL